MRGVRSEREAEGKDGERESEGRGGEGKEKEGESRRRTTGRWAAVSVEFNLNIV